jgi:hypothetical protein
MRAGTMLVGCWTLIGIGVLPAASQAPNACVRSKLSASARAVEARMACQVAAVRTGRAVDGECAQRPFERLSVSFARADRRGPCPGGTIAVADSVSYWLGVLLERVPGSGTCPARKLAAAGHKVARRLRCQRRDPDRVLECFARADEQFVGKFTRAERDGSCAGDAGTVESLADGFASDIGLPIAGPPPSTTSTTTTTIPGSCGNGMVDPGEECDGQSYCTGACRFGPTTCYVGCADAPLCVDGYYSRLGCLSCLAAGGSCMAGVCAGVGCADQAIAPVTVCCQFGGGCATDVATSISQLGLLYYGCAGQGFPFGIGICGVDGVCHPGG